MSIFDVNNIAFTAFGTPMSYIEIMGFCTGFLTIYLASCGKVINFWFGLLNCIVYFSLFYQNQLFSSMLLQIVFFSISAYGIYKWSFPNKDEQNEQKQLKITTLSAKNRFIYSLLSCLSGLLLGFFILHYTVKNPENHVYTYYWDGILTAGSIFAQYLLTRKKIDNWYFWIVIDVNYIGLFLVTNLKLTALLYLVYTFISVKAIVAWRKELKINN